MQHPWKNFATDYVDRGSDRYNPQSVLPPSMYPSSPSHNPSQPSYNRSPAPFMSAGSCHPPPAPAQYQTHEPQLNPYQSEKQEMFQQQHHENQQQFPPQPQYMGEMVKPKNPREDPDIDEDFPSYKDLRSHFLNKQKQAEREQAVSKPQTLPRRKISQPSMVQRSPYIAQSSPSMVQKPPSPRPHKPPSGLPQQIVNYSPTSPPKNYAKSPQKPRRTFLQLKQEGVTSPSNERRQFTSQPPSPVSPTRGSIKLIQNKNNLPNGYHHVKPTHSSQEIPVPVQYIDSNSKRNIDRDNWQNWQHIRPDRASVRYNPPLSLSVPTYNQNEYVDHSAPKVVITSNSPKSPQKAFYRGGNEEEPMDWIVKRRNSMAQRTPAPLSMSSTDNTPRRRASYAEIMITHNSLPRQQTLRRSVSQTTHDNFLSNGMGEDIELFPRQRRYHTLGRSSRHVPQAGVLGNNQRFARGHMQQPSMDQMLYPSAAPNNNFRQQQSGGWSATVRNDVPMKIVGGPHVISTPNNKHPGKSAAHLQYNSPMALYSTQNAQQELANDEQAAELLQIIGDDGKASTIKISPTLQAVLREDAIKKQTGEKPSFGFYHNEREYGPGYGPLRQYEENPDTLRQTITVYNKQQDSSLHYPMWAE